MTDQEFFDLQGRIRPEMTDADTEDIIVGTYGNEHDRILARMSYAQERAQGKNTLDAFCSMCETLLVNITEGQVEQ